MINAQLCPPLDIPIFRYGRAVMYPLSLSSSLSVFAHNRKHRRLAAWTSSPLISEVNRLEVTDKPFATKAEQLDAESESNESTNRR